MKERLITRTALLFGWPLVTFLLLCGDRETVRLFGSIKEANRDWLENFKHP